MAYQTDIGELQFRVDRLQRRGRVKLGTAVTNFQVSIDAVTNSVQVSFQINTLIGVSRIRVLRNTSRDPGSAKAIDEFSYESLYQGKGTRFPISLSVTDGDPTIVGQVAYYWIAVVPASDKSQLTMIGPQSADQTGVAVTPNQLSAFDASHAAAVNGIVAVSVNVTPADKTFDSLKIYVSGYQGQALQVAIAQEQGTSFTFNMLATGETVTLYAVAVGPSGKESSLAGALTKSLTLSAGQTVPCKPMNMSCTEQTGGVQITFPANPEAGITNYLIYRGLRQQGFANASQIGTVTPSGSSVYTFLDSNGLTGRFEYYLIAVDGAGNSATSIAIVQVQQQLSSADAPSNDPSNTTNHAVVTSSDAGSDVTIDVSGTGGAGTSWTRPTGFGSETYPHFTILHKSYNTKYWVAWDRVNMVGVASTDQTQVLPDNYVFCGVITTVASGGGGGTTGGGGSTGGPGGGIKIPQT